MFLDFLLDRFSRDLAIDLGTANTLIYVKGRGIMLDEPSVVAIPEDGRGVLAVGKTAKEMFGRTPKSIKIIRPMKDGVIADFEITQRMIKYFIKQVSEGFSLVKPKIIVCVPSGITAVEKRAVIEAVQQTGCRRVMLIEEPMAAAIGAGLLVEEAAGNMVVDIGGGTTEVAVITMCTTAYCESIRVAGDEMDEAVAVLMRRKYNLDIGLFEAEKVKMTVGSAYPLDEPLEMQVRGIDLLKHVPRSMMVNDTMIREALQSPVNAMVDSIRRSLERVSPEIAMDISAQGICLAGGGALLKGLDRRLSDETGLAVTTADDPLTAIVRGTGKVLDNLEALGRVCIN